jgi:hypothetical protein
MQQDDVLNSLQAFERLIIVLKSGADDAGAEPLKKLVLKMHRQLTAIERRTDVRTQKRLFAEFREEIQRTLLPEALKRL